MAISKGITISPELEKRALRLGWRKPITPPVSSTPSSTTPAGISPELAEKAWRLGWRAPAMVQPATVQPVKWQHAGVQTAADEVLPAREPARIPHWKIREIVKTETSVLQEWAREKLKEKQPVADWARHLGDWAITDEWRLRNKILQDIQNYAGEYTQKEGIRGFVESAGAGIKQVGGRVGEYIPFYGWLERGDNQRVIIRAIEKMKQKGFENLFPHEKELLTALGAYSYLQAINPPATGATYTKGVAELLRYGMEFLATAPIGGAVARTLGLTKAQLATRLASTTLPRALRVAAIQAGKAAGGIMGGAVQSLANVPMLYAETARRLTPDLTIQIDRATQDVVPLIKEKGGNFIDAIGKQIASQMVEYGSERLGFLMDDLVNAAAKTVGLKLLAKLGSASKVKETLNRFGIQGLLGEVFEEEIAQLPHAKLEGVNYDPLWTTAGGKRLLMETAVLLTGLSPAYATQFMEVARSIKKTLPPEAMPLPAVEVKAERPAIAPEEKEPVPGAEKAVTPEFWDFVQPLIKEIKQEIEKGTMTPQEVEEFLAEKKLPDTVKDLMKTILVLEQARTIPAPEETKPEVLPTEVKPTEIAPAEIAPEVAKPEIKPEVELKIKPEIEPVEAKPAEAPPLTKKMKWRMPKELIPLFEEAKKYKTADEFIEAQEVVYHNSGSADVDYLESQGGIHFGSEEAALTRIVSREVEAAEKGLDIYKTEDGWNVEINGELWAEGLPTKKEAEELGYSLVEKTEAPDESWEGAKRYIRPAVLIMKNPMRMYDQGANWSKAIKQAKREGCDGIIYVNEYEDPGSTSYIVFSKKQIVPIDKLKQLWEQAQKEIKPSIEPRLPLVTTPEKVSQPEKPATKEARRGLEELIPLVDADDIYGSDFWLRDKDGNKIAFVVSISPGRLQIEPIGKTHSDVLIRKGEQWVSSRTGNIIEPFIEIATKPSKTPEMEVENEGGEYERRETEIGRGAEADVERLGRGVSGGEEPGREIREVLPEGVGAIPADRVGVQRKIPAKWVDAINQGAASEAEITSLFEAVQQTLPQAQELYYSTFPISLPADRVQALEQMRRYLSEEEVAKVAWAIEGIDEIIAFTYAGYLFFTPRLLEDPVFISHEACHIKIQHLPKETREQYLEGVWGNAKRIVGSLPEIQNPQMQKVLADIQHSVENEDWEGLFYIMNLLISCPRTTGAAELARIGNVPYINEQQAGAIVATALFHNQLFKLVPNSTAFNFVRKIRDVAAEEALAYYYSHQPEALEEFLNLPEEKPILLPATELSRAPALPPVAELARAPPEVLEKLKLASDEELIKMAKAENTMALGELIHRHTPLVTDAIRKITQNPDDIQDLINETWTKVQKHLKEFQGKSKFSTWLWTIARNAALNWTNKQKIRRLKEVELTETLPSGESPEKDFYLKTIQSRIESAIEKLSPKQQEVIKYFYEGYSFGEIAERMNLSVQKVRALCEQAFKQLATDEDILRALEINKELPRLVLSEEDERRVEARRRIEKMLSSLEKKIGVITEWALSEKKQARERFFRSLTPQEKTRLKEACKEHTKIIDEIALLAKEFGDIPTEKQLRAAWFRIVLRKAAKRTAELRKQERLPGYQSRKSLFLGWRSFLSSARALQEIDDRLIFPLSNLLGEINETAVKTSRDLQKEYLERLKEKKLDNVELTPYQDAIIKQWLYAADENSRREYRKLIDGFPEPIRQLAEYCRELLQGDVANAVRLARFLIWLDAREEMAEKQLKEKKQSFEKAIKDMISFLKKFTPPDVTQTTLLEGKRILDTQGWDALVDWIATQTWGTRKHYFMSDVVETDDVVDSALTRLPESVFPGSPTKTIPEQTPRELRTREGKGTPLDSSQSVVDLIKNHHIKVAVFINTREQLQKLRERVSEARREEELTNEDVEIIKGLTRTAMLRISRPSGAEAALIRVTSPFARGFWRLYFSDPVRATFFAMRNAFQWLALSGMQVPYWSSARGWSLLRSFQASKEARDAWEAVAPVLIQEKNIWDVMRMAVETMEKGLVGVKTGGILQRAGERWIVLADSLRNSVMFLTETFPRQMAFMGLHAVARREAELYRAGKRSFAALSANLFFETLRDSAQLKLIGLLNGGNLNEFAKIYAAEKVTNIFFRYDPFSRSVSEQTPLGRILLGVTVYPRGVVEGLYFNALIPLYNGIKTRNPNLALQGFTATLGVIGGMAASRWLLRKITGRSDYWWLTQILGYVPIVPGVMILIESWDKMNMILHRIEEGELTLDKAARQIVNALSSPLGLLLLPFVKTITSWYAGIGSVQGVRLGKLIYKMLGGDVEFQRVERTLPEKLRLFFFGTESPEAPKRWKEQQRQQKIHKSPPVPPVPPRLPAPP